MTARALLLGLDVSALRIGWAIVEHETGRIIRAGGQILAAGDDLRARRGAFLEVARTADGLGDVCAVILEDAYAGPNRAGTIRHALAVGNVEAFAGVRWPDVLVDRVAPATWRSVLGLEAKGKADPLYFAREQYQADTGRKLGECVERRDVEQDAADAVCIARAGVCLVWNGDA